MLFFLFDQKETKNHPDNYREHGFCYPIRWRFTHLKVHWTFTKGSLVPIPKVPKKAKYPKLYDCNIDTFKEIAKAMDNLISAYGKAGDYTKQIEVCKALSAWAEDGKPKFNQYNNFVQLLKEKARKDASMQSSYVRHTSVMVWIGLLVGEYKVSKKH
ncbi:MAG: hypothetical protein AAGG68_23035 [Bacteroidota bacterium]